MPFIHRLWSLALLIATGVGFCAIVLSGVLAGPVGAVVWLLTGNAVVWRSWDDSVGWAVNVGRACADDLGNR